MRLQEEESNLNSLNKDQKDMLKSLSVQNADKFKKQLMDVARQWADCKKITEARQVNNVK